MTDKPSFKALHEDFKASLLPAKFELVQMRTQDPIEAFAALDAQIPAGHSAHLIRVDHSTAVVLQNRDTGKITVTIDPSPEWTDKIQNFKVKLDHHQASGGTVHRGFQQSLNVSDERSPLSFKQQILEKVETLGSDWKREYSITPELTITGYSKGGAEAFILGSDLLETPPQHAKLTSISTFGSPTIGDKTFTDHLETKAKAQGVQVQRVLMANDPVPDAIRRVDLFNIFSEYAYTHEQTIMIYPANEGQSFGVAINPTRKEEEKAYRTYFWDDHSVEAYEENLAKLAKLKDCLPPDVATLKGKVTLSNSSCQAPTTAARAPSDDRQR